MEFLFDFLSLCCLYFVVHFHSVVSIMKTSHPSVFCLFLRLIFRSLLRVLAFPLHLLALSLPTSLKMASAEACGPCCAWPSADSQDVIFI